ncbi:hypothetical protein AMS68_000004 [Peltaster fructicola]|uniref:Uncharacterized protein n=1 Tax=Peltaster fructicola TaxID=286661 RepID=A0A6H0XID9_9PEZI|nr:hypothetical protein AMS68_000004 [Peltaster fructicola]
MESSTERTVPTRRHSFDSVDSPHTIERAQQHTQQWRMYDIVGGLRDPILTRDAYTGPKLPPPLPQVLAGLPQHSWNLSACFNDVRPGTSVYSILERVQSFLITELHVYDDELIMSFIESLFHKKRLIDLLKTMPRWTQPPPDDRLSIECCWNKLLGGPLQYEGRSLDEPVSLREVASNKCVVEMYESYTAEEYPRTIALIAGYECHKRLFGTLGTASDAMMALMVCGRTYIPPASQQHLQNRFRQLNPRNFTMMSANLRNVDRFLGDGGFLFLSEQWKKHFMKIDARILRKTLSFLHRIVDMHGILEPLGDETYPQEIVMIKRHERVLRD